LLRLSRGGDTERQKGTQSERKYEGANSEGKIPLESKNEESPAGK